MKPKKEIHVIKQLRSIMAIAVLAMVMVVCFSPQSSLAAEKAVLTVAIANYTSTSIQPIAAGADRYDKSADLVSLSSPYAKISAARTASQDGYMNWRMHDTIRIAKYPSA